MAPQLGKIHSIEELKSYGSFKSVKESILLESGMALRANSWKTLYEKISELVKNASEKQKYIEQFAKKNTKLEDFGGLDESKSKISNLIGYKLSAKSWDELYTKTEKATTFLLLIIISKNKITLSLDEKKKIFNDTKYKNFVSSSRLEGVRVVPVKKSIDDLIKKYKQTGVRDSGR